MTFILLVLHRVLLTIHGASRPLFVLTNVATTYSMLLTTRWTVVTLKCVEVNSGALPTSRKGTDLVNR